ncbi:MAG: TRAP transporter large permease [Oscillospiraceae bacterium]|nr:TRAP transporter large permease [Oscillospiraceae bacterium]
MAPALIALIVFLIMMAMIFLGIPVFIAMLSCSFVGMVWLSGGNFTMAITMFTQTPYSTGASFNYAVLPLFMVVGVLAGLTGIAEGAFKSMRAWIGRLTGGLLYTVIGANAVFGACSGNSVASSIVFAKMSLPELRKTGYSEEYSLGCICASSALATLIPPSMGIITFCLVAPSPITYNGHTMTLSVGAALCSGILPAILTIVILCIAIRLIGHFKPGSIPPGSGEKVPFKEKLKTLRFLIPILLLFMLIIGGTMLGWFAATIGGAIGAMAVCIYALFKRIPLKKIFESLWDATVMEGAIFIIIISGSMFSKFISATGVASTLANMISNIQAPAYLIFVIVVAFYIVCGCVMDIVSIIIITVPVVFPVLAALGFNPYVLVITLCFMTEIASVTPPIGMNVFATSNALQISPTTIFKGILPFFVCEVAVVLILAAVPSIVTFLPSLLGYSMG